MFEVDVMTVLGARPQFIKAGAVSPRLEENGISELLVHTGQHFDENMSRIFFEELRLREPDVNLGVHGGGHGEQTGRMMIALEGLVRERRPRCLMVYGDTNTTLAAALVAAKLHVPVVHVEAGLRSRNLRMPEEINRICTDQVSSLLFSPSEEASRNLRREGFNERKIVFSGDVMYDVASRFKAMALEREDVVKARGLQARGYALATVHRAENTDDTDRLREIVHGLASVAQRLPVVWPLHPRTRQALQAAGVEDMAKRSLIIVDPVGYLEMVQLESSAALVLTDSGGVQKESYFHQVPCVTLRDETEWKELVEHGFNELAGANADRIRAAAERALQGRVVDWETRLYGDGDAGGIVATSLRRII